MLGKIKFYFCILLILSSCNIGKYDQIFNIGNISVGKEFPLFTAVSSISEIEFDTKKYAGEFYIYFIAQKLPLAGYDQECGKISKSILLQNGHLFCFSDLKVASIIGIPITQENKISISVLVITDRNNNILFIFKNVSYNDIKNILDKYLFK